MQLFNLLTDKPIDYVFTGKFEAPSKHWMHENFPLDNYELFVMTKGTLYIAYNEEKFEVHEGEMLLLPPRPAPYNRRVGYQPSDCSFYWLHFTCQMEEHTVQSTQIDVSHMCLPKYWKLPHPEKVLVLMKQLQDGVRLNYGPFSLNTMTTHVLCEVYEQFASALTAPMSSGSEKQIYQDIVDYIHQNLHTRLTVSAIAKHFGYNEKYLSHRFSSIASLPLKQFILKSKIDSANFLLTDTNLPIGDIALSLGYSDSQHFMRSYKKHTGLTPSEYRNAFSKRLLYHK